MMGKLIPLLLALIGLGAGIGGGMALRPMPEPMEEVVEVEIDPEMLPEYVKMNNQFVVPVLEGGQVAAMVILSLSLEVKKGASEEVYSREPKLRDAFLQVMFDHANSGGFSGSFTDGSNLILLREALLEMANKTLGDIISDVLISDIVRQDS
jgi:flagellar protein FliL